MTPERVLVTGATGFLGRNALPVLRERYPQVVGVHRADYDLTDPRAAERMFADHRPDVVVHLAGLVGGLGANRDRPADFCHENLLINAHAIHAAHVAGVQRFVAFVGGCSYPKDAPHPIPEHALWAGYPQPDNAPYSAAKRMVPLQLDAYRRQYGLSSAVAIPGNVYGPWDNFREAESHVVPALVRRFHEAAARGDETVTCWGSGEPSRDFLFAGDLARCLPFLIERYDDPEPINLARSERTTIRELAETVARVVGYTGRIEWDTTKPDGQREKVLDVTKMRAHGIDCPTTLEDGLRATHAWFAEHVARGDVRV